MSYANSKHVSPPISDNTVANAKLKQPNKAKLLEKEINVRNADAYTTRSGHISKLATQLITSM